MVKSAVKSRSKKDALHKKHRAFRAARRRLRRRVKIVNMLIVIVAIAIISVGAYLIYSGRVREGSKEPGSDEGENLGKVSDYVLARVNGEPIMASEIEKQYTTIPEQSQPFITREIILNQTINKLLLLQEAEKEGISISYEEVDDLIFYNLDMMNRSLDDFKNELKELKMDFEEFRESYRDDLIINRLINETIVSQIEISEAEVGEFYDSSNFGDANITIEDVEPQIKDYLTSQKVMDALDALINKLRKTSSIELAEASG
ncbi:hypothetical protein COT48_03745 [Candidatus Woesearchaeota archaeon CG08_land_8_20_14_0_20_47_9]|nr:MAG: hypothetical protein AUJ69_00125 [Candidatus Woesearchaeota archaeon CG1_02_47_18]PIN71831.1 MAG: hypothetical protein COV22_04745 [Candidatus Woesearchaeota archaeon CG10_big_fil_rev_8_21_14_0_10_47_5]PIO03707.1 MAG: hypothetical protein COT48_03745 [Candidatus Woesearchaeota archaeon CG08_land_8_20_14_0_20_47_9]HII29890.1 hypothetical protein [Candidatus Woesearchaeota archaeon]